MPASSPVAVFEENTHDVTVARAIYTESPPPNPKTPWISLPSKTQSVITA